MADIIGVLDALEIERASLVGHSFGSFVARQAAVAYPQRVAALVLIGTGYTSSNEVTQALQKSLCDLPRGLRLALRRRADARHSLSERSSLRPLKD